MRKITFYLFILIGLLIIGLSILGILARNSQGHKEKEVHFHAGFQVYRDNKLVNFSDIKYMHDEPCSEEESDHNEDEQLEKAHLHDMVGDVVHVHRENALWLDLFTNLSFTLKDNVLGFVNGEIVSDILHKPIAPNESVIFLEGNPEDISMYLASQITLEHISQIEDRSESCSSK